MGHDLDKLRDTVQHRIRARLHRFPNGCQYIGREIFGYRELLESAVVAKHGGIDVYQAGLIQSACRAEAHARIAWHELRTKFDTMGSAERVLVSRESYRASFERDKAVKELDIGVEGAGASIYALLASLDCQDSPEGDSASDGQPGALDGKPEGSDDDQDGDRC